MAEARAVVTCFRCGQEKPRMESSPMPGKWGAVVQAGTCADCWRAWVDEQTRLMNHHGLKGWVPEDRTRLYAFMREFLNLPERPG